MRGTKYRGKIKEKPDQWIYGSYLEGREVEQAIGQQEEAKGIIFYFKDTDWNLSRPIVGMEVLKNTVGEWIGLKDTNNKEIFEGDIVKMHQFCFDGNGFEKELIGTIVYDYKCCAFCLSDIRHTDLKKYVGCDDNEDVGQIPICMFYGLHEESWEVIGNVYDGCEFLEKKT